MLSSVSLLAPGASASAGGVKLSTQTTTFTLSYNSSPADSGKFAQVNFFDFGGGVNLSLTSATPASSTGCDHQVLGGDAHTCMFKLDNNGSARITGVLSEVTKSATFKYMLLSGPNMTQTEAAVVSFAVPDSKVKALAASTNAMAGGAAVLRFRFFNGNSPAAAIRASVVLKGVADHISATSVVSDAQGYVWVFVANIKGKIGTSTVTLTVEGNSSTAKSTIKWVKGSLGK
jgi:hypothetical protein